MKLKEPKNVNYAATVVSLSKLIPLENCDNVQSALIFGNSVIVSKTATVGELGLYFPVESQLSPEFLGANNLFRKPEWGNIDPTQKGFFEQHGRVKAMKFRGHKSEGFWIPFSGGPLDYCFLDSVQCFKEGTVFDAIGDHEICRKYVPKCNPAGIQKIRGRQARLEDKIVAGQFRFHYDTENLRRNYQKIHPEDWISISDKWHGTSVVISNILVNRKLKWYEKILVGMGVNICRNTYGLAYSSRRVLKEVAGETKTNLHFYKEDIWGIVAKEIQDVIPKGYTVYGEIVGYTPEGKSIQKGYHYGCPVGGHRLLVYRVTSTNADGNILELNWTQMLAFCTKYGLEPVKTLWYGQAKEIAGCLFDDNTLEHWQERFLSMVERDYMHDQMCPYNNLEVPAEGIVVRIDHLDQSEAYKLKNFKYLEWESKELDQGEVDIETNESEETNEENN